jgi:hypothetical protein
LPGKNEKLSGREEEMTVIPYYAHGINQKNVCDRWPGSDYAAEK